MRIVSSEVMGMIDREAQTRFEIPGVLLMENAGIKGYKEFLAVYWSMKPDSGMPEPFSMGSKAAPGPMVFAAGPGNNGGDALVMAREAFLTSCPGTPVIILVREECRGDTALHVKICRNLGIRILVWELEPDACGEAVKKAEFIFDGISGTGQKGPLRGGAVTLLELLNRSHAFRVAIDIPSGLGEGFSSGDPVFKADLTLTMGLPKRVLYLPSARLYAGDIKTVSPGFPPELLENPEDSGRLLTIQDVCPVRFQGASYKKTRGHLGIFAGSEGTTGAALLAGKGAQAAGSGLVTIWTDPDVFPVIAGQVLSMMCRPVSDRPDRNFQTSYSAFLAGPGWGRRREREKWLKALIDSGKPGVIDADGIAVLKSLSASGTVSLNRKWILTPHPGEFQHLSGVDTRLLLDDPLPFLGETAKKFQCIICFKCHVTYIVSWDGSYAIVDGMNPALGTGGSGDILAGIIAGFLAGGADPLTAAESGVVIHQEAGRILASKEGWFTAENLAPIVSRLAFQKSIPG